MLGGIAAIIGAFIVGPRKGFFDSKDQNKFKAHNVPLVVLGTFILWFGWFGFNAGSTLSFTGENIDVAAKVSVNTSISAAIGGATVFFLNFFVELLFVAKKDRHMYSIGAICNGILAGLVGITAPCGNVNPWAAAVIGFGGGVFYYSFERL